MSNTFYDELRSGLYEPKKQQASLTSRGGVPRTTSKPRFRSTRSSGTRRTARLTVGGVAVGAAMALWAPMSSSGSYWAGPGPTPSAHQAQTQDTQTAWTEPAPAALGLEEFLAERLPPPMGQTALAIWGAASRIPGVTRPLVMMDEGDDEAELVWRSANGDYLSASVRQDGTWSWFYRSPRLEQTAAVDNAKLDRDFTQRLEVLVRG